VGCFEAEAFSGSVIETMGDESDVLVGDVIEIHVQHNSSLCIFMVPDRCPVGVVAMRDTAGYAFVL